MILYAYPLTPNASLLRDRWLRRCSFTGAIQCIPQNISELLLYQPLQYLRQRHHRGRTAARPAHLGHAELALHALPRAAPQLLLVDTPKSAMLVVNTLLQNYDYGGVLGQSGGIAIAIAECAAHLRRLSCLHGEMLG